MSDHAIAQVSSLKAENGKGIWLCGGANLAAALFAARLIDRLIVKVNPFLMGTGIPLFAQTIPQTPLELTNSKTYAGGVVRLQYRVGN
ncbi:dihydrofolate reductase family protein [Vasconcelosia minhoensis]|uniref:dihydrofolate reductase family protein n=1 Tax=Vasconcelosia minhoensis TaxID=3366354 RepID=UPI002AD32FE3|nr:dihydrofolate reductase family protein [Romeria gracilis]